MGNRWDSPETVLGDEHTAVPPDGEVHDPVIEVATEDLADEHGDLA